MSTILVSDISLLVWFTAANLNRFHILDSLLQRRHTTEANRSLHDVWPSPGLIHYIYIDFRGLLPQGNLAKFNLCLSLALCYIGSITAWHSSSGRQPNFAAWYMEWNY